MPSQTTIPSDQIRRHIATLRGGSYHERLRLIGKIKAEECTADLVEAMLANLDIELAPKVPLNILLNSLENPNEAPVTKAMAALPILLVVAQSCVDVPRLIKDTAPLVVASLEGIIAWSNIALKLGFTLSTSAPGDYLLCYLDMSQLFIGLGAMGNSVRCALASSTSFARLLIKIWTARVDLDTNGQRRYCMLWHTPTACPVTGLLEATMNQKEAKHIFLEELIAHGLVERFASATVGRAKYIGQEVAKPTCADGFDAYVADLLLPLIDKLVPFDDQLRPYFRRYNYIAQLTRMSNNISISLVKKGSLVAGKGEKLMEIMDTLIRMAALDPHMVRNYRDLLAGGYLEMQARTIVACYANDCTNAVVKREVRAMALIDICTVYPAVCKTLAASRLKDPDPHMAGMYRIPSIREAWRLFWDELTARVDLYMEVSDTNYYNICDNALCKRSTSEKLRTSKQCSRCSSVVYCSASCQRVDWEVRHRAECVRARRHHIEQKDSGKLCSHRSRAFLAQSVLKRYVENASAMAAAARARQAMNAFFPVFDFGSGQKSLGMNDTKQAIESFRRPDEKYGQGHLQSRIHSLLESYASGSMSAGVRLAQGLFIHGPGSQVSLFVLLKANGYKSFEVIYSIARVSPSDVNGPLPPGIQP